MKFSDDGILRGTLNVRVYKIIDGIKNLIDGFEDDNLITISGLELIAFLLVGHPGNNKITKVGVGDGTSEPGRPDTGLTNAFIKSINSYSFPSENSVKYRFAFNSGDGNGLLVSEFGLFSGDEQMFSRKLRIPAIPKNSDIIIEGDWTVQVFQCKEWLFSSTSEIKFITQSDIL